MSRHPLCERIRDIGRSLFDRGFVVGSAGNISAREADGRIFVTPTGGNFGRLRAEEVSELACDGTLIGGSKPSKELPFHQALYRARPEIGGIVHLHSTHLTALSCLRDLDRENAIRAFTPYYVMRIGSLPVVPYYPPGDRRIAEDLEALARRSDARGFLLASHGPVVVGRSLEEAADNAEELEETARLLFVLNGRDVRHLSDDEISVLRR